MKKMPLGHAVWTRKEWKRSPVKFQQNSAVKKEGMMLVNIKVQ